MMESAAKQAMEQAGEQGGRMKAELGGVVVLDFGGQYTQLIARRIREQQVFSAVLPCTTSIDEIRKLEPAGIVLSGGPSSVYDADAPKCDANVLALGIPVLGICYGMQWIMYTLGGTVERAERREYGRAQLSMDDSKEGGASDLFTGIPASLRVWNSHGDHVRTLPEGFRTIGRTENALSAVENAQKKIYAVEFHPEVNHNERGTELLRNFLFRVCEAEPKWSGAAFIEEPTAAIREKVGNKWAICGLSGGVDSNVAAVLVQRAVGTRLTNIFVNTGMLRKNEFELTLEMLRDRLHLHVIGVDAADRFLAQLKGVTDPEEKRKRIGREFIAVFAEEAQRLQAGEAHGEIGYLVQGTLYPDVIESVSVKGPSATIKTHHNVGGLPEKMPFALVEPLRDLFKDEVRRIGKELGLPEEIRRAGLYNKVWQAFAVLLPVRSVGVMGDGRTYGLTVAVRVVESDDAMTADWVRLPGEVLERISTRIVNEVTGVTRVVYDISSKPPSTIEWE